MQMTKILSMLNEEMRKSKNFPQENFGMEFVKTITADDAMQSHLMIQYMTTIMSSRDLITTIDKTDPEAMRKIVMRESVYKPSLSFLYWGIQIGKQLAVDEVLTKVADQ